MDGTVISDAVNLTSRLENLTKVYGVSLLISHHTLARLQNPMEYRIRFIDKVKVKGKSKAVAVFEVFDGDEREIKESKLATKAVFEEGLFLYHQQATREAAQRFEAVLNLNPRDTVAQIYLARCQSKEVEMRSRIPLAYPTCYAPAPQTGSVSQYGTPYSAQRQRLRATRMLRKHRTRRALPNGEQGSSACT